MAAYEWIIWHIVIPFVMVAVLIGGAASMIRPKRRR